MTHQRVNGVLRVDIQQSGVSPVHLDDPHLYILQHIQVRLFVEVLHKPRLHYPTSTGLKVFPYSADQSNVILVVQD